MPRCRSKEKRDARAQRPQFLEGVRKKQLDAQAAVVATELNKVREEKTQCDALKVAIRRLSKFGRGGRQRPYIYVNIGMP